MNQNARLRAKKIPLFLLTRLTLKLKTPERKNTAFSGRILIEIPIFLQYVFTKIRSENDVLFPSEAYSLFGLP